MSEREELEAKYSAMTREELAEKYLELMHRNSLYLDEVKNQLRFKPIFGGRFGHGGFLLVSHWNFYSGLDEVVYYVVEASTRFVVARGDTKQEALEYARNVLTSYLTLTRLHAECAKFKKAKEEAALERQRAWQAQQEQRDAERRESMPERVKSIPRRRKQIFEEAEGKCHYCSTPLTLDGKWHIEHKMPKALGGDNQPGNLVASCVSCNHKKRDTTDVEFKARLAKESA